MVGCCHHRDTPNELIIEVCPESRKLNTIQGSEDGDAVETSNHLKKPRASTILTNYAEVSRQKTLKTIRKWPYNL